MSQSDRALFYQPKKKTGWVWLIYLALIIALGILLSVLLPPWLKQIKSYSVTTQEQKNVLPATQASTAQIQPGILADQQGRVNQINQVPMQGGWINSEPLNLPALAASGHYVLIYFWSAEVPASVRANRQVEAWWKAYRDSGLVVVGVHVPKYTSDERPAVVLAAAKQQGLTFPILLDGHRQIAKAFNQHGWPGWQVMDPHGQVVLRANGEAGYAQAEQFIRGRLVDDGWRVPPTLATMPQLEPIRATVTPDLYLGTQFMRRQLGNGLLPPVGKSASYDMPATQDLDSVYLSGIWKSGAEAIQSQSQGSLLVNYLASSVYLTLASASGQTIQVPVLLDGQPVPANLAGPDLHLVNGQTVLEVNEPRVYIPFREVVLASRHTLTLWTQPSLDVYGLSFADFAGS